MRDALAARVQYYRELGIQDFYRRSVSADAPSQIENVVAGASEPDAATIPAHESPQGASDYAPDLSSAVQIAPMKTAITVKSDPVAALQAIRDDLGDCKRCPLHRQGRKQIVFGTGNPEADLMFIGEAPGADEDQQGIPFVGRAGQLLNNMIAAMGLKREDVYIANVIKCRPPGNRTPEPAECAVCSPFLRRQVEVIQPKAIVALGAVAAKTLLAVNQPISALRGRWYEFDGVPMAVTFHPAYLLRNPAAKKDAWKDLQMVMKRLGLAGKK